MTGFNRKPHTDQNQGLIPGTLTRVLLSGMLLVSALVTTLFPSAATAVTAGKSAADHEQFHGRFHPNATHVGVVPDSVRLHGAEVDSIKNVENISDWQTLDTKHLTLRINNAQRYLLTLDDQCMHLRGARMVGVSMTNQEIWADFDHIAADGWECRIDTITRLGRKKRGQNLF